MNHASPSRRDLLAASGAAALGLSCTTSAAQDPTAATPPGTTSFRDKSPALEADRVVDSACQFCNSLCRLKVHLKAGRVIDIRGEEKDPVQHGELCVKGQMMA